MLRAEADEPIVELPSSERRELLAKHCLLQDPRATTRNAPVPAWRRELQDRARQALEQSFQDLQQRRQSAKREPI
jgi:hypothetical protein